MATTEWKITRCVALPPDAGGAAPDDACVAAHPTRPELAVGGRASLCLLDALGGGVALRCALPSPAASLAYAPPGFAAAAKARLFVALDGGKVLALDPHTSRLSPVACAQPPKAGYRYAPLLLPLAGARALLVTATPGRSSVFATDVSAALSPAAAAAAAPAKLRTEHKRPVVGGCSHPSLPVAYVAYEDGSVRGYDASSPPSGGAPCVRASLRLEPGPGAGGRGVGAVPACVCVCLVPFGASGGSSHLLIVGDTLGRLSAFDVSPISGAAAPLAVAYAGDPTLASPPAILGVSPMPSSRCASVRLDDGTGEVSVEAWAMSGGAASSSSDGGQPQPAASAPRLFRCPPDAPLLPGVGGCVAAARSAAAASSGSLLSSASALSHTPLSASVPPSLPPRPRIAAAAPLAGCGASMAVLLADESPPHHPTVLLLTASSVPGLEHAPCAPGAAGSFAPLCVPHHTPMGHWGASLTSPDGSPPQPPTFAYPPSLRFSSGGLLGSLSLSSGSASPSLLAPLSLPPGASIALLVGDPLPASPPASAPPPPAASTPVTLVFVRPSPGEPPAAFAAFPAAPCAGGPGGGPLRPGSDAAFFVDGESRFAAAGGGGASAASALPTHAAVLDPGGGGVTLYTRAALLSPGGASLGAASFAPPSLRVSRLFPSDVPDTVLAASLTGGWVGRISLGAALRDGATAVEAPPAAGGTRLRLRAGEAPVQAAWQRLAAKAPRILALLTTQRALLVSGLDGTRFGPIIAHTTRSTLPAGPPGSMLWHGPALLLSTAAGVCVLCWDGGVARVASTHAASLPASAARPADASSPPVLVAALPDRLVMLQPCVGASPHCALAPFSRPFGAAEPLLRAWASLAASPSCPPGLPLRAALLSSFCGSDALRLCPSLLPALPPGLALALVRAQDACVPPPEAAAAAARAGQARDALTALAHASSHIAASFRPAASGSEEDASRAAKGEALSLPPTDPRVSHLLTRLLSLAPSVPAAAWAAAMLLGSGGSVVGAARAGGGAAGGALAPPTPRLGGQPPPPQQPGAAQLTPRAAKLADPALRAAASAAVAEGEEAAARDAMAARAQPSAPPPGFFDDATAPPPPPSSASHPPFPPAVEAWPLRPAPSNGARIAAGSSPVPWADPRCASAPGCAVAGTLLASSPSLSPAQAPAQPGPGAGDAGGGGARGGARPGGGRGSFASSRADAFGSFRGSSSSGDGFGAAPPAAYHRVPLASFGYGGPGGASAGGAAAAAAVAMMAATAAAASADGRGSAAHSSQRSSLDGDDDIDFEAAAAARAKAAAAAAAARTAAALAAASGGGGGGAATPVSAFLPLPPGAAAAAAPSAAQQARAQGPAPAASRGGDSSDDDDDDANPTGAAVSSGGGGGGSGGGGGGGRKIVVAIRAAAPALPPKPLPRLAGLAGPGGAHAPLSAVREGPASVAAGAALFGAQPPAAPPLPPAKPVSAFKRDDPFAGL